MGGKPHYSNSFFSVCICSFLFFICVQYRSPTKKYMLARQLSVIFWHPLLVVGMCKQATSHAFDAYLLPWTWITLSPPSLSLTLPITSCISSHSIPSVRTHLQQPDHFWLQSCFSSGFRSLGPPSIVNISTGTRNYFTNHHHNSLSILHSTYHPMPLSRSCNTQVRVQTGSHEIQVRTTKMFARAM